MRIRDGDICRESGLLWHWNLYGYLCLIGLVGLVGLIGYLCWLEMSLKLGLQLICFIFGFLLLSPLLLLEPIWHFILLKSTKGLCLLWARRSGFADRSSSSWSSSHNCCLSPLTQGFPIILEAFQEVFLITICLLLPSRLPSPLPPLYQVFDGHKSLYWAGDTSASLYESRNR